MEPKTPTSKESYLKHVIFIIIFFTITPIALFSSVLSLIVLSNNGLAIPQKKSADLINNPRPGVQVFASLPSDFPSVSAEVVAMDARPLILEEYLKKYDSPLAADAQTIVEIADKYQLDWRLTTAIAQKESGLCRAIPENSFNCWGWGIHSKGVLKFDSFAEGVETVSRGLREYYLDQGFVSVEEIMTKYAHPSSTTWAEGVNLYISQIE